MHLWKERNYSLFFICSSINNQTPTGKEKRKERKKRPEKTNKRKKRRETKEKKKKRKKNRTKKIDKTVPLSFFLTLISNKPHFHFPENFSNWQFFNSLLLLTCSPSSSLLLSIFLLPFGFGGKPASK